MICDLLDAYAEDQPPTKVAVKAYERTPLLAILGLERASGREAHREAVEELYDHVSRSLGRSVRVMVKRGEIFRPLLVFPSNHQVDWSS